MKLPAFYPILDLATIHRLGLDPVDAAQQLLDGGARILQFRDKYQLSRATLDIAARIHELAHRYDATFVVNDRADLAKMFGAAVHLGQDDLPATAARRITGDSTIIGLSTHTEAQLIDADQQPVDYLAIGPIFGTASKENPDPVIGLETLKRVRRLTSKPLVAIGGITRENARAVLAAGADSVAIIGDAFPADGKIRARTTEWIRVLK